MRFLLIILISLLLGCSQSDSTFYTSDGKKIKFSDYRGKWIFVNYWAKWCHNCKLEIADLNKFAFKHSDKVVVFGVNYDALVNDDLRSAVHQFNINYPVLQQDPSNYLHLSAIDVVPVTIVINPRGQIIKKLFGPQTLQSLELAIE